MLGNSQNMNCLKYIKKQSANGLNLIDLFAKSNINVTLENDGPRAILYCKKFHTQYTSKLNKLFQECNGLIINLDTMEILATPPPPIQIGPRIYDGHRTVTEANDGTMISLYYYNGWRISTSKAYDITDICPPGYGFTYKQILDTILLKYPNFSYDNLIPGNTYTLCMCSKLLHPYENTNKLYITSVRSSDCRDLEIGNEVNMFYKQAKFINSDTSEIIKMCKSNDKKSFGCIVPQNGSNIYIESTLMKSIRHMYYNNQLYQELNNNLIINKKLYVCIRHILVESKTVVELFPHFKDYFERVSAEIEKIKETVTQKLTGTFSQPNEQNALVDDVCSEILKKWTVDDIKKNSMIIYSYIYTPNRILDIYAELSKNEEFDQILE